jgi:soluble lytic murein transglycosylase-like protein
MTTVEELLAQGYTIGQPSATAEDLISQGYTIAATPKAAQNWNILDSVKNLGSGIIEGTTGLAGLVADLNPLAPRIPSYKSDGKGGLVEDMFPTSTFLKSGTDQLVAPEDPKYRYARTIGQMMTPLPGEGLVMQGARAIGAGVGAQGLEDITGDTVVAPLVGALAGGAIPSVFSSIGSTARSLFRGATPAEIKGSAALAQKELTGLSANEIEAALQTLPEDDLARLMTTAEVTKNAGMGQIEKTLANSDDAARMYAQRAALRENARGALLNEMSPVEAVNKEGLGSILIAKADETKTKMGDAAEALWKGIPRDVPIDTGAGQNTIASILGRQQGGLDPSSKVTKLVDQFLEPGYATSGKLQDIRSDALTLGRDANLMNREKEILGTLQSEILGAMERGLEPQEVARLKAARAATALKAETFRPGTAGGALTNDYARPSNVLANALKGDKQSVLELRSALGNDVEVLDQVKRAVIDNIPRDSQGRLTADKVRKYLAANQGQLTDLLGEKHTGSITRILEDLQSEADVANFAFKSSKGNSVTAQRGTVAGTVRDTLLGALLPGSGTLSKLADAGRAAVSASNAKQVEELLFRAAMNPTFAAELAKTPTNARIFNAMDQLKALASGVLTGAAKSGTMELARTQEDRSGAPTVFRSPARQAATPGASGGLISTPTPAPQSTIQNTAPTAAIDKALSTLTGGKMEDVKQPQVQLEDSSPVAKAGVASDLVKAVILQESAGKKNAVSKAGAQGLMQLMPATGREWHAKLNLPGEYDPFDAEQNKTIGTAYLEYLLNRYDGDEALALTAYNQGFGRIDKLLARTGGNSLQDIIQYLGPDGRGYAKGVLTKLNKIRNNGQVLA